MRWLAEDTSSSVFWLFGSAGTGKTAIGQSIAEMCKEAQCLAAAFFFFRTSPERNTHKRLIATIAYQISSSIPELRPLIAKAVEDDHPVMTKDMRAQISQLIVEPLLQVIGHSPPTSRLLVIVDGLDECIDEKEQCTVLNAISEAVTKHIPLCFLVTSRPEHQIRTRFKKNDLIAITKQLDLDEIDATTDIQAFLHSEFSRIKCEYSIPDDPLWPAQGVVESLADRASGQFIYAATVVKFVDDRRARPHKRLNMILGSSPPGSLSPFAEIDALYTQILSNVPDVQLALLFLGVLCGMTSVSGVDWFRPTNFLQFDQLFLLESGEASLIFADLYSIVAVPPEDVEEAISIRHKSLQDFLFEESRSGTYRIDTSVGQCTKLLMALIRDWVVKFDVKSGTYNSYFISLEL